MKFNSLFILVLFAFLIACSSEEDDIRATEWWSSTLRVDVAITRAMWSKSPLGFARYFNVPKDYGISVRCINNE